MSAVSSLHVMKGKTFVGGVVRLRLPDASVVGRSLPVFLYSDLRSAS